MTSELVPVGIVVYLVLLGSLYITWPAPRSTDHLYLRRVVAVIAMLLIGPIGLVFAFAAFADLKMVVPALWTGVFRRPDFLEGTGDVIICRTERPGDFWNQVTFYAVIGAVLGSLALVINLPLVTYIWRAFRRLPN